MVNTTVGAAVFDPTQSKHGLKDGGLEDGIASADEMLALYNNPELLKQSSTGGLSIMQCVTHPAAQRERNANAT